jgi:hypothetical protein
MSLLLSRHPRPTRRSARREIDRRWPRTVLKAKPSSTLAHFGCAGWLCSFGVFTEMERQAA